MACGPTRSDWRLPPLLIFWAASTSPAPSPGSILSGPLLDFLLPLPSTSHLAAWFLRLLAKTHTHKTIVNVNSHRVERPEGNPSSLLPALKMRSLTWGEFWFLPFPPLHPSTYPGTQHYFIFQTVHHYFIAMPLLVCSISPYIWVYFWTPFFCSSSSS